MTGKVPKKAMAQGIIKKEIQNQEEESNVSIIQTKSKTNFSEIIQKCDKMQSYIIHDCFYDNENMKTVANCSDYSIIVQEYFYKGFKAGTTQVTRTIAKLSTTGADLDLYQASNRYVLKRLWFQCLSKKHTQAKNEWSIQLDAVQYK